MISTASYPVPLLHHTPLRRRNAHVLALSEVQEYWEDIGFTEAAATMISLTEQLLHFYEDDPITSSSPRYYMEEPYRVATITHQLRSQTPGLDRIALAAERIMLIDQIERAIADA